MCCGVGEMWVGGERNGGGVKGRIEAGVGKCVGV